MSQEAICIYCGSIAGQNMYCSKHCMECDRLYYKIQELSGMGIIWKPVLWVYKTMLNLKDRRE